MLVQVCQFTQTYTGNSVLGFFLQQRIQRWSISFVIKKCFMIWLVIFKVLGKVLILRSITVGALGCEKSIYINHEFSDFTRLVRHQEVLPARFIHRHYFIKNDLNQGIITFLFVGVRTQLLLLKVLHQSNAEGSWHFQPAYFRLVVVTKFVNSKVPEYHWEDRCWSSSPKCSVEMMA